MSQEFAHRRGSAVITVTRPDGAAYAGPVTVEQTGHQFGFGNIGFDLIALANGESVDRERLFGGARRDQAEHLAELWFALYNNVTLPFYWRGFEREQGKPDTVRILRAAQWFADRGATVKGHPLVWHTLTPCWLADVPPDQVEATIRARVTRDVGQAAGIVTMWDAINEAVIMPVFTAEPNAVTELAKVKGRVGMVRLAFETARAADPQARLVLNDFDLSADYEHLIEECLAAGIAIDALGLQTHMHQGFRGEDELADILGRFSRFGLPLQFTETTLVSGELMPAHIVDLNDYQPRSWPSTPDGEERQAEEMVRHYRTLLAHPAVELVTYWGLSDDGMWLGAPGGLVRADGTRKPSYDALHALVRGQWWVAPHEQSTDAAGRVVVTGFGGTYALEVAGERFEVTVPAGGTVEATAQLG